MTLVGSPAIALGEPTSLYLDAARKAETRSDHRTAVCCLCNVLLEVLDKRPGAAGLSRQALSKELKMEFSKLGLYDKVNSLDESNFAKLHHFLELELDASDPGKSIEVFSDGSFYVVPNSRKWDNPSRLRILCTQNNFPLQIYRKGSADYDLQLKRYWWFKLPSVKELASKPVYVPNQPAIPSGPDGAFADYRENK